ncbi:MAG: hypothetical protein Q4G51_03445 [Dermatophilus congolensis]|nr:hypothetical protein [Dermatophilus congolensis]
MSAPAPSTPPTGNGGATSVIHDLGYRGYDGPRRSNGAIAWSLFLSGLAHSYGIGRVGKAKFRPFALLGAYLIPAMVMIGVLSFGVMNELPTRLVDYAAQMSLLVSIFAAAQAPVLFSRDLQHRSIVLYLARPLPTRLFALMRYLSMTVAVWLFMLAPVLLLYFGGMLTGVDPASLHPQLALSLLTTLLASAAISALTGVVSAWTVRPGLAVVASIGVLIVGNGLVSIVQALGSEVSPAISQVAGVFTPYMLSSGVGYLIDSNTAMLVPPTIGWVQALFVALSVIGPVVGVLLIQSRFAKAVAR